MSAANSAETAESQRIKRNPQLELLVASDAGDISKIEHILKSNPKININVKASDDLPHNMGATPLMLAGRSGKYIIVFCFFLRKFAT